MTTRGELIEGFRMMTREGLRTTAHFGPEDWAYQVHDEDGGSTYCHHCNAKLIGRDWYVLTAWNLDDSGKCRTCGTLLPGVFEKQPGTWGAKRLPVRLANAAA